MWQRGQERRVSFHQDPIARDDLQRGAQLLIGRIAEIAGEAQPRSGVDAAPCEVDVTRKAVPDDPLRPATFVQDVSGMRQGITGDRDSLLRFGSPAVNGQRQVVGFGDFNVTAKCPLLPFDASQAVLGSRVGAEIVQTALTDRPDMLARCS